MKLHWPMMLVMETASGVARITKPHCPAIGTKQIVCIQILITLFVPIDQVSLVDETVAIAAQYKLRGAGAIFVALAKMEAVPLVSF